MTPLRHIPTAAAAMSLVVLATACAQVATATDGPGGGSYGADEMVLRVDYAGGLNTPTMAATRPPMLAVYGDGRVITEAPQILVYPGPALPNLQVQRISPADVEKLLDLALDAGVGSGLDFGEPPVADATTVRFTARTQLGYQVAEVYAPHEVATDEAGLSEEQAAARTAMQELLAQLTDLSTTLEAGAISEEGLYRASAVAAVANPWAPSEDEHLDAQAEIAWPGPELPGDTVNAKADLHCVTVTGDEATQVLAAAAQANELTPWISGGEHWLVTLRPLLPDESGCADLPG